ncbi:MAG: hypothetical protein OEZ38_14035 [Gammaproteobacteria bacterium]|nr:hypothetical protein [Gammaproteobacteria bacterium]
MDSFKVKFYLHQQQQLFEAMMEIQKTCLADEAAGKPGAVFGQITMNDKYQITIEARYFDSAKTKELANLLTKFRSQ